MGPVRKLSKAERLHERKERRRLRKAQKKYRRKYSGINLVAFQQARFQIGSILPKLNFVNKLVNISAII